MKARAETPARPIGTLPLTQHVFLKGRRLYQEPPKVALEMGLRGEQRGYTPVAGAYVALPRVRVTAGERGPVVEQCCASCGNWKPSSAAFVSQKPGARCGTCRALERKTP
jgi:hypothetical protein